ncbi:MAG: ABC transporter permease subunit [Clostridia bacterium]|nr:ABC transporter permease subunit [Clostridia bacterium]
MIKQACKKIGILLFWLLAWWIAATFWVKQELFLPSPIRVLTRLGELVSEKEFWIITATSLGRIFSGILIALVLGVFCGVLTARFSFLRELLSPILSIIKATPVASFIILALVWISRGKLPIFISILMVLPIIWANTEQGIREIDPKLLEMAKIFRFSYFKRLVHITIPSVLPYFIAACRASLGLAWKAGIAAEVLATPQRSIGKELFESKTFFEMTDLFAWTVTVIVLSICMEKLFFLLLRSLLRHTHTGGAA